jgi:gamma-glutamyltranspeptidase
MLIRVIQKTSQPLATQAGIEVLKKGGNAADAAIAVGKLLF